MDRTEQDRLRAALREVIDPETAINVVDLGLIYALERDGDDVTVDMTLTSPACPLGESIAADMEDALRECLPADARISINLVWEPAWSPSLMNPKARAALGWEA